VSWMFCGKNRTTGQWMGYGVPSKCHKRGCGADIDRGLSFVCGGMHEGDIYGCGYYFCKAHLDHLVFADKGERIVQLCAKCLKAAEKALAEDGWTENEDGEWVAPAERVAS
jgi:hypothetical protein